jgi:TrmH family RNA methyltransferase
VVEGPVLVAEAVASGVALHRVFSEPDALTAELAATLQAAGVEPILVQPGGLGRVLDTATPRPVAAVVPLPTHGLDAAARSDLVLVLADVADPGNVGTLVRTAEAAGVGAVVCCGTTADPYAPKAVRASAGSILRLAVVVDQDAPAVLETLGDAGVTRLALSAGAEGAYDTVDLAGPVAVVLGSEAHGLAPDLTSRVDLMVSIPMVGSVESLNVATAGAIVCFEVARQRRARR